MIYLIILFVLSAIISIISLFYSISAGYFEDKMFEQKLYKDDCEEKIENEKKEIVDKYISKVYIQ